MNIKNILLGSTANTLIICVLIALGILVLYNGHYSPPLDIKIFEFNNSNNSFSPMPESLGVNQFGITILFGVVGIVALLMSVLGLFFTLLLVAIGNFRQQFYDTVFKFYQFCQDTKKLRPKSGQMCIDGILLYKMRGRNSDLYQSADNLSNIFKDFTRISMGILFFVMLIVILHFIFAANLWMLLWAIILFYIIALLCWVYKIMKGIEEAMSYPELAEIQNKVGNYILNDLENSKKRNDQIE